MTTSPDLTPLLLARACDPAWADVPAWAAMIERLPDGREMSPGVFRTEYVSLGRAGFGCLTWEEWLACPDRAVSGEVTVRELAERSGVRAPEPSAAFRAFEALRARLGDYGRAFPRRSVRVLTGVPAAPGAAPGAATGRAS